jgi:hypothetical protein
MDSSGPWSRKTKENAADHVVILPPNVLRNAPASSIANKRSAMISGWGADPNAEYRYRAAFLSLLKPDVALAVKDLLCRCGCWRSGDRIATLY